MSNKPDGQRAANSYLCEIVAQQILSIFIHAHCEFKYKTIVSIRPVSRADRFVRTTFW